MAAGLGPLGLGTDGEGSIRIPASACGVVGLKPTTGAVPYEQTSDSFFNYAAAGPLTRTIADAAVMMDTLVGPSTLDPWSLGAPGNGALPPSLISEDLSRVRIGYLSSMSDCSPDLAANLFSQPVTPRPITPSCQPREQARSVSRVFRVRCHIVTC